MSAENTAALLAMRGLWKGQRIKDALAHFRMVRNQRLKGLRLCAADILPGYLVTCDINLKANTPRSRKTLATYTGMLHRDGKAIRRKLRDPFHKLYYIETPELQRRYDHLIERYDHDRDC